MDRNRKREPLSESDVIRIFETLGLETEEQREKVLFGERTLEPIHPTDIPYETILSNDSGPPVNEE